MCRFIFSLGLFCLLVSPALAEDAKKPEPPAGPAKPTRNDGLRADPNDVKALNSLMRERLVPINELMDDEKLDEAEKKLGEFKQELADLAPTEEASVKRLDQLKQTVATYVDEIDVQ